MAHYWKAQAKEVNRGTAPSVGRYAASDARRPETLDSPFGFVGILKHEITLTWNPASAALQARGTETAETAKTVTIKAS